MKFVQKKCVYPKSELEKGIEGTPIIQFIVQRNGIITDIRLYKSSDNILFDNEAIRIVKLLPKWIPGECKGEKVATVYYLPIRFRLK